MSVADMAKMLREGPKMEEMMKNYKVHMDLLNKVIKEITAQKVQKIVQLEQLMISGQEELTMNKVNNTSLVKQVS